MQKYLQKILPLFKTKTFIILSVFCFIALLGAFLIIKSTFSYSFLENLISDISGLKVELINPETTFDYKTNLNFSAKYINIYSSDKKKQFASIEEANISFKPLGLLFKKAYFKNLNAKKVELKLSRDEKGNIDLLNSIKKQKKGFLDNKIKITRLNSKIDDLNLLFMDNYVIKSDYSFLINDSNIYISKKDKILSFKEKGTIKTNALDKTQQADFYFDIFSKYPMKNFSSKDLSLNVRLNNLNLYIFNDIMRKYISKDIEVFSGIANLNLKTEFDDSKNQKLTLNIINPSFKLKDNKQISPYKKGVNLEAVFEGDKNFFNLKDFKLNAQELGISGYGTIKKPFSKNPESDLKIKIANTQINNLVYFLPDNLIFYRQQGIPVLKKSNFFAKLNGDINLKYSPLDITGSIKANNIHIPDYPKSYIENNVNLTFMNDKMRVYTKIYTPENEYILIDGVSNLDNSLWGKYSIKSTDKIDLSFAKLYLVPIQQIIGFNIGPVPIMDLKGYGSININTQGTIKDAQIFGEFKARNASAKIEGLDALLTNGNCKIVFDNRNIIFKEIKGKLKGAEFFLSGKANTKGEVSLNTKITNAKTSEILKIFNNSIISKPYLPLIKNIAATSGDLEADINLDGQVDDFENKEFFNKLLPSGSITLRNNKVIFNNKISMERINGVLNFGLKQHGLFSANLNNSKINFEFQSPNSLNKISLGEMFDIKTSILSDKLEFIDILETIKPTLDDNDKLKSLIENFSLTNFFIKANIKSQGKISLNNINFKNFKNQGYITGLNSEKNKNIKFNSAFIKIEGDKLNFNNLDADILSGKIKAKGNIYNFLTLKPQGDLAVNLENIDIKNYPVKIKNALVNFKGSDIKVNSANISYNSTPLFLNALIKDIYNTKILNCDFSTILDELSADTIINPYLISPIKIKGEIPLKGTFKGNFKNYSIDADAIIPEESDISFLGANLGDIDYKREVKAKIDVKDNCANIQNLKLIKYITNQNNKINPLIALKADGKIEQKNKELHFNNFKLTTNSPINVRILNLIFKKSLLKKGNFVCNLNLNGLITSPKVIGKIYLADLDIPLYNTQINDIKINITDKFIDGEILAKNKQSDLNVNLKAQNNLSAPYMVENMEISSNKLDGGEIIESLNVQDTKSDITKKSDIQIKSEDIIVKKGTFDFKEVLWDEINAQNLKGTFNYKDNIFVLENIIFDIADGQIEGGGNYSLKSTKLDLKAKLKECNSNILSKQFLHLSDQIFGKIDGSIELSAEKLNTPQGIKTVQSNIDFSINDGKMPKLGSLEYLLRAGNLIRNGLLGLSLNNIIQVLTPYKTGEFDKITGNLSIKGGMVEKLEILSKGKNLSLYLEGSYSILENFADIKIYGKLSQNISNALGALGNASINQFINTISQRGNKNDKDDEVQKKFSLIPPIENENQPRYFRVKVLGDINKENYIKSFKWD